MSPRTKQLLCVALALGVLTPSIAMARPGQGKALGKDNAAQAAKREQVQSAPAVGQKAEERAAEKAAKREAKDAKQAAKADAKAAKQATKQERKELKRGFEASLDATGVVPSEEASAPAPSEEASPTAKATGIANALSHVQRNLERAAARGKVPPGLVRVVAKFLSWLGLAPDAGDPVDPIGSGETSGTVPPSDDTSGAVPPSDDTSGAVPPSDETTPVPGSDDTTEAPVL